jgi:hypothetical protein
MFEPGYFSLISRGCCGAETGFRRAIGIHKLREGLCGVPKQVLMLKKPWYSTQI